METFDGLAILATNLRSNIDEAFTRRLDAVVDFPLPTPMHRRVLWAKCLESLPCEDDLDSTTAPTPSSCPAATSARSP